MTHKQHEQLVPDPRADFPPQLQFPEDSKLWTRLLVMAFKENRRLAWALWTFRLQGARIIPILKGDTYKLIPVIDPTGGHNPDQGWESEAVWRDYAGRHLGPHRELLKELFLKLRWGK